MALKDAEVAVLGAGVAGLAVARALALRGARVTVLEQADAIREVGAGLQISPNGAAVLRALGLGDALEAASVRARAVVRCDGLTGETVTRLDLGRLRPGQGWYLVHRADLIALLLEGAQAAGAELRLLQRIETVDLEGARPRLVTGQGAELATDLLIGADGLHSRLRATYEGGPRAPFFTHQIAWRTVIPADPSDPAEVEVHMGPGRHLVSYPLRGGTLRNIVAVEERRRWAEEGWSLRDDPMEMRLAFADFGPRVQRWMEAAGEILALGPLSPSGGAGLAPGRQQRDSGRCGASDAALPGAGREPCARGCLGAGRLPAAHRQRRNRGRCGDFRAPHVRHRPRTGGQSDAVLPARLVRPFGRARIGAHD
jgi:salicylate hydroxylase